MIPRRSPPWPIPSSEDWHEASHYDPPDPLTVELVTEDDQPHDSELIHE